MITTQTVVAELDSVYFNEQDLHMPHMIATLEHMLGRGLMEDLQTVHAKHHIISVREGVVEVQNLQE